MRDIMRQVFFSFEYDKDNWRTAQIRNIGQIDGEDRPFSDNDWESVRKKDKNSIKSWIDSQLNMRSCVIVLVGETTSTRPWVRYEITQAYLKGKGIFGIYINGLKDKAGNTSRKGKNPFQEIADQSPSLSGIRNIQIYEPNPSGKKDSQEIYACISDHISDWIETAIGHAAKLKKIRDTYDKIKI